MQKPQGRIRRLFSTIMTKIRSFKNNVLGLLGRFKSCFDAVKITFRKSNVLSRPPNVLLRTF